jgi:hypothetical protein
LAASKDGLIARRGNEIICKNNFSIALSESAGLRRLDRLA